MKRYREPLDEVESTSSALGEQPVSFRWRGHTYEVVAVLGHWREDPGWWRGTERVEQSDLWRVEARNGTSGVYELANRGRAWRLDRIWD